VQDTVTRCPGLVTQFNPLATQPGYLIQADDAVVRRENVFENRRGHSSYGATVGAPDQLMVYSSTVLAQDGTKIEYDNGSGAFTPYSGSYSPPSGYKMRSAEALSNLYFTSSTGIQVLTDTAGTAARKAGAPRSLDPSYALNAAGAGFLTNGNQCAYRCVISFTDANSNLILGYPSTRLVVYNTAATSKNIDLTLYLPSEVSTSHVIQFYRTAQVTGTGSDIAGDEMALVYQVSPSSTDISNGYITFTDSIVDALRGAALYTSPSQEGIGQANERPPLAKDTALFKSQFMFYSNTSTPQRLNFTMVGTASLSAKTITLSGVTYNFGATEITSGAGSPQAKVYATGVAASDIDNTARSLVRVINRYASNTTVYAYYLSGPDDLPGQIMIQERGVGGAAFTIQASDTAISAMFFPPPPVGSTNTLSTSTNQVQKNALYFSKVQQPEHVPALNYVLAGPANKNILRIAPLRDSLIIIKEEGVYRLTGDSPVNFVVTPLDLTVYCKAINSVVVLANQVFMLSNQGVVAITDNGVQVVSREIEPNLSPLLTYSNLATYTAGCAYESERMYMLSTITSSTDTAANQTFVFNIFTRAWTRWTLAFSAAVVETSKDKLYFGKPGKAFVYRERKDFAATDYADAESSITITAISGNTINFTLSGATPAKGWMIQIPSGANLLISSVQDVGGGAYVATMVATVPSTWATGAATIYPCISMVVVWGDWSAGQPGLLKQVRQVEILTDNISTNTTVSGINATFKTDLDPATETVSIASQAYRWGTYWGVTAWGGGSENFAYRTFPPMNKNYARIFNFGVSHAKANEKLSVNGISYTFEVASERVGT
jgi:hypothetical protein